MYLDAPRLSVKMNIFLEILVLCCPDCNLMATDSAVRTEASSRLKSKHSPGMEKTIAPLVESAEHAALVPMRCKPQFVGSSTSQLHCPSVCAQGGWGSAVFWYGSDFGGPGSAKGSETVRVTIFSWFR